MCWNELSCSCRWEVRVLQPEHLPFGNSPEAWSFRKTDFVSDLSDLDFQPDEGLDYYEVTEMISNQVKKHIIAKALRLTGGNRTKAAEILGLSRSALWREMAKIERWQEKESTPEE